jgi:hypothetical protein
VFTIFEDGAQSAQTDLRQRLQICSRDKKVYFFRQISQFLRPLEIYFYADYD